MIRDWPNRKTSKHFPEHSQPSLGDMGAQIPCPSNPLLQLHSPGKNDMKAHVLTHAWTQAGTTPASGLTTALWDGYFLRGVKAHSSQSTDAPTRPHFVQHVPPSAFSGGSNLFSGASAGQWWPQRFLPKLCSVWRKLVCVLFNNTKPAHGLLGETRSSH